MAACNYKYRLGSSDAEGWRRTLDDNNVVSIPLFILQTRAIILAKPILSASIRGHLSREA